MNRIVELEDDFSQDDARWHAIETRSGEANGHFFSCVKTTGIYCIASCPARPKRENVTFVDTIAEARTAGFRPCKRCKPDNWVKTARSRR